MFLKTILVPNTTSTTAPMKGPCASRWPGFSDFSRIGSPRFAAVRATSLATTNWIAGTCGRGDWYPSAQALMPREDFSQSPRCAAFAQMNSARKATLFHHFVDR